MNRSNLFLPKLEFGDRVLVTLSHFSMIQTLFPSDWSPLHVYMTHHPNCPLPFVWNILFVSFGPMTAVVACRCFYKDFQFFATSGGNLMSALPPPSSMFPNAHLPPTHACLFSEGACLLGIKGFTYPWEGWGQACCAWLEKPKTRLPFT